MITGKRIQDAGHMTQDTGHRRQETGHRTRKGQMSLVMIVVVAVGLILFAVTMNWGRVSQTKTMTMIAANTGAAQMASSMASYGEAQLRQSLGGQRTVCKYTGLLALIVTLVIAVVTIVTAGATAGAFLLISQITVLLSVAAIAINVMIVEPGITRLWNKMQKNIQTVEGQFLERGIQTALQAAVNDSAKVNDYYDGDSDGRLFPQDPGETISRFGYYYNQRMSLIAATRSPEWRAFQAALEDLAVTLGVASTQNTCCAGTAINPNFCDPCCAPEGERPSSCSEEAVSACSANPPSPAYPLNYDPLFCATYDPKTLVGFLGRDDDSVFTRKNTPYNQASPETLVSPSSSNNARPRGEDSYGQLFPFLWWMADTHVKISDIDLSTVTEDSPECHWCAATGEIPVCRGADAGLVWKTLETDSVERLVLPFPCVGEACCIARFANNRNDLSLLDPRQMDDVPAIDALVKEDDPGGCPADGGNGLWRKGADSRCTPDAQGNPSVFKAPYFVGCDKYVGTQCMAETDTAEDPGPGTEPDCGCGLSANKDQWRDDEFDVMVGDLREAAKGLRPYLTDFQGTLGGTVKDWYNAFLGELSWVTPLTELPDTVNDAAPRPEETMTYRMTQWRTAVQDWLNASYAREDTWCLPLTPPADMTAAEQDAVTNGTEWGSLSSVIQCLDYNADNAGKFLACHQSCAAGKCSPDQCRDLPRSLVEGFDPNKAFSAASSEYKKKIEDSYDLAVNQSAKFRKRADYLVILQDKAQQIVDTLNTLIPLVEQQARLVRTNLDNLLAASDTDVQMPNYVIYGWKTPEFDGKEGLWHLVKVEGNLPRRCADPEKILRSGWSCGTDSFPWVRAYKKGSFKRCFSLTDTDGCVMTRVTRYDEDNPANSAVTFLNRLPLWRFLSRHPEHLEDQAVKNLDACVRTDDRALGSGGAFMINGHDIARVSLEGVASNHYDDFAYKRSAACRDAVVAALRQGFVTDSCARYYMVGNVYKLRFVDCSADCLGTTYP